MREFFEVLNPAELGEPRGWSNGLLADEPGRILFVAGQTAMDPESGIASGDFVSQFATSLDHILTVVREAGGDAMNIGRLTIYVTDLEEYRASLEPLGRAYRARMGRHYPAMSLVQVKGLVEAGAKVEIEATAVIETATDRGDTAERETTAANPD